MYFTLFFFFFGPKSLWWLFVLKIEYPIQNQLVMSGEVMILYIEMQGFKCPKCKIFLFPTRPLTCG
jgi:hypothetical protein